MDEANLVYIENIKNALQSKDVTKLMELVPTLEERDAITEINEWHYRIELREQRLRETEDTTDMDFDAILQVSRLSNSNNSSMKR